MRSCTTAAQEGVRSSAVMVEQMMRSSSLAATPALSSAARAAASARSEQVSVVQQRRVLIPVRLEIHASSVSRKRERSLLVTTCSGRALPVPIT